mmetsp:Transcript_1926/g.5421  ORF Transcript_1926/g.5421 Transcript_1926/m.5421 type:complete len:211 (+) Transcript_1926:265-897(+)
MSPSPSAAVLSPSSSGGICGTSAKSRSRRPSHCESKSTSRSAGARSAPASVDSAAANERHSRSTSARQRSTSEREAWKDCSISASPTTSDSRVEDGTPRSSMAARLFSRSSITVAQTSTARATNSSRSTSLPASVSAISSATFRLADASSATRATHSSPPPLRLDARSATVMVLARLRSVSLDASSSAATCATNAFSTRRISDERHDSRL